MSDILFEVTKDQLETGMRGFPVGYCTTSFVDPEKGLFYRGRAISEMRDADPEAVMYFLFTGKDPKGSEYSAFVALLEKHAALSKKTIHAIEALPREGHSMKLFCCAIQLLGMMEGTGDYKKDALLTIAKLPHLVATVINHHAGWGKTKDPTPETGYMKSFTHMLNVPGKEKELLEEVFRLFNILHYDHGGGNLSAFVGKAVASGLEDMFGSLSASMCALAGPRHGKANQDCLAFVQEILNETGENATEKAVEEIIRKRLTGGGLVFGFGHAVLRKEDSRAAILYDYVQKNFPDHPLTKMVTLLRKVGPKVLSENPKITNPYPNVDAVSGAALSCAGFTYPEYYTVLFGLSRCVGISTQIVYERMIAREGKGTPIVRPKYLYKEMK